MYYRSTSQHSFRAYQTVTILDVINELDQLMSQMQYILEMPRYVFLFSMAIFGYTCTLNLKIAIDVSSDSCSGALHSLL